MDESFAEAISSNLDSSKKDNFFLKKLLDVMVYFVGIVGPGMALPEVYRLWVTGTSSPEFAMIWVMFGLFSPFWIVYGLVHKKTPIVVTYAFWYLVCGALLIGTLVVG